MIFKSKKGTETQMWPPDTLLFWLLFGIILGFVAVYFVVIVAKIGSEQAKINENLESFNLMQRLLKSPNCLVYEKEGIVLQNVIDYNKFAEERLKNCYITSGGIFPAFKLILNSESAKIDKTIKTSNWNENREFEERIDLKDILVYSEDKLHNGKLAIEVQNLQ